MKTWAGFSLIGAMALSGCMAHVALPEAPTSAPYPVRVQAYNAHRPLSMQYTTTVSYGRYGVTGVNTAATGLVLANGANVFHPEDLIPMAGQNSPSAAAARESQSANSTADILFWSGIGASLLGTGLALGSLFTNGGSSYSGINWPLFGVGMGVGLGGSITILVGSGFRGAAARHRETSYQLYDQSLRQNLGLCGDGTQMGDCGAGGAMPSMTQPIPYVAPGAGQPAVQPGVQPGVQQGVQPAVQPGQPQQLPPPPPPGDQGVRGTT
jgi:hypothetical protein